MSPQRRFMTSAGVRRGRAPHTMFRFESTLGSPHPFSRLMWHASWHCRERKPSIRRVNRCCIARRTSTASPERMPAPSSQQQLRFNPITPDETTYPVCVTGLPVAGPFRGRNVVSVRYTHVGCHPQMLNNSAVVAVKTDGAASIDTRRADRRLIRHTACFGGF
jgi:hypothetical protein